MTDGSNVKSVDGSIGTCRNPTDRGRKGIKFLTLSNTDMITRNVVISPANQHDVTLLKCLVTKLKPIKCLADSGFVGKSVQQLCVSKNIELIARPKKTEWSNDSYFNG